MGLSAFYYALLLEDGTVLRVSTTARGIFSIFMMVLPIIVCLATLILMVCILIGRALTIQLIKPINDMAEHLDDPAFPVAYKELKPFADKIRNQHVDILSAAKARQDFTANVSHELKTPLTAISGYSELIENHMVSGAEEERAARQIRSNANRLLALINDIIRLSEMDHRELPRNFEHTDLCRLAQECAEQMQLHAEKKKIALHFHGTAAGVNADRELLHEMIINLIQNAIAYNRANGSVWVSVSIEEGHSTLRVKDNGIGIPADKLEHVFERFYRVDKSRSRETGGTGLGLAIVKHIAEIHSAEITMNSEMEKGTEVMVRF